MNQTADPPPMNLCSVCQRLGPALLRRAPSHHSPLGRRQYIPRESRSYIHHSSYLALAEAAEKGCDLCSLLRESILSAYVSGSRCPRREAEVPFLKASRGDKPCCVIQTNDPGPELVESLTFEVPDKLETSKGHTKTARECISVDLKLQRLPTENNASYSPTLKLDTSRREVTPSPNFDWVRRRIQYCYREHAGCTLRERPALPTRVIDVSFPDGKTEPRLWQSEGSPGRYVTLSHCWGHGNKHFTTTSKNYKQLEKKIEMAQLPPMFRDAVLATRKLGYKFLWIDSLCIIQDNQRDREAECARMDRVYSDAEITLGCLYGGDSSCSFLQDRTSICRMPLAWEYSELGDAKPRRVAVHSFRCPDYYVVRSDTERKVFLDTSSSYVEDSPLEGRAWVLQERLLSRRTLYFSEWRMMFECRACTWYEDELHPVVPEDMSLPYLPDSNWHTDPLARADLKKAQFTESASVQDANTWYAVVEKYTRRGITNPFDTLPAISGLVRVYWKAHKTDYVAGLLKHRLPEDLAWYVGGQTARYKIDPSSKYTAPSWTWASSRFNVIYDLEPHGKPMMLSPRASEPLAEWRRSVSERIKLTVLNLRVDYATRDPFGHVTSGTIEVEGRVRLMKPFEDPMYYEFHPDDPKRPRLDWDKADLLCLAVGTVGYGWGALVLEDAAAKPAPLLAPGRPVEDRDHGQGGMFYGRSWGDTVPLRERSVSLEGRRFRRVGYWRCIGDKQFRTPECNPFWDAPMRKVTIE
ncbi:hypothetical protein QQZ08_005112 [Neonectria magnoliae]|uniref:Heterokaryon incompatibility domain-containing protein n=1 Tax=Neonectria magnoliae TaxID=2732573 RepID=A0ABR1I489_9HYPO